MLNFDPKQFLAESREGLAGLAALAGRSAETENADSKADPANVANAAKVWVSDAEARSFLREWHANLSRLDTFTPPDGFTAGRWADMCDDACWLYETHASQLAREGWSALDVFGVSQRRGNGEVLLDRLRGARNLRLDGQGRAIWSRFGVTFITCRGAAPAGMRAVWEIG